MPATITLTVTHGSLPRPAYVFAERTTCLVGRDAECDPQAPDDNEHRSISRLHCLLDINPPDLRIRDLGSLFGTFVNGVMIGQREREEQRGKAVFPEHDLKDGDEVRLGDPDKGDTIAFRVAIFVPARCSTCTAEVAEEDKARAEKAPGVFQCATCRHKAETALQPSPPRRNARACARCGKDISTEVGRLRQGEFTCAACKADPLAIVSRLLDLARSGQQDLLAIQGYRIERLLGKGGIGAVYLVRHDRTGERIAGKGHRPGARGQARHRLQDGDRPAPGAGKCAVRRGPARREVRGAALRANAAKRAARNPGTPFGIARGKGRWQNAQIGKGGLV
jgi:eukaryotic-like serine/threonine-protein kinase